MPENTAQINSIFVEFSFTCCVKDDKMRFGTVRVCCAAVNILSLKEENYYNGFT